MGISYDIVLKYTKDIPPQNGLSPDMIEKIRDMVQSGITKRQVSEDLNLNYATVKRHTLDILVVRGISPDMREKMLKVLKKGFLTVYCLEGVFTRK